MPYCRSTHTQKNVMKRVTRSLKRPQVALLSPCCFSNLQIFFFFFSTLQVRYCQLHRLVLCFANFDFLTSTLKRKRLLLIIITWIRDYRCHAVSAFILLVRPRRRKRLWFGWPRLHFGYSTRVSAEFSFLLLFKSLFYTSRVYHVHNWPIKLKPYIFVSRYTRYLL